MGKFMESNKNNYLPEKSWLETWTFSFLFASQMRTFWMTCLLDQTIHNHKDRPSQSYGRRTWVRTCPSLKTWNVNFHEIIYLTHLRYMLDIMLNSPDRIGNQQNSPVLSLRGLSLLELTGEMCFSQWGSPSTKIEGSWRLTLDLFESKASSAEPECLTWTLNFILNKLDKKRKVRNMQI